jgi:anti-anti-sigma regulatory factor
MSSGQQTTASYKRKLELFNEATALDAHCRIQLFTVGPHLVLKIVGAASRSGYQELAKQGLDIITSRKADSLVIDLTLCEQLTSSPLGMIGLVITSFKQLGGTVHVVTSSELVKRSLRILGLDKLSTIHDDVGELLG